MKNAAKLLTVWVVLKSGQFLWYPHADKVKSNESGIFCLQQTEKDKLGNLIEKEIACFSFAFAGYSFEGPIPGDTEGKTKK